MKTEFHSCPKCGAPVPADAVEGLCPKCLLAAVAAPTEPSPSGGQRPESPPLERVAAAFPHLEVLELIGAGGMGAVYKARQPNLDRFVALKVLPEALGRDQGFAERFEREARVLARLNHPNIVTLHDFGRANEFLFLLMEYVDGVNLRQALQAGRFTPQQALSIVPKICEALQYAHEEGILHRDIKPANILLDAKGRVKIADFGIAKLLGERRDLGLTVSGVVVGTPNYMAPEQIEHPQDVDERADIYSLGVVFYEMLTGELPLGRFAPPSAKADIDPRLDAVVMRSLEKERERRYRSATEVKTSVENISASSARRSTNPRPSEIPERHLACRISTPEHLQTSTGRFVNIFTGEGELRLQAEALVFVSRWEVTSIPWSDIRELAVGHYPRVAKPLKMLYLAVTFSQDGKRQTLLFTPGSGFLCLPWEVNRDVRALFRAVRQAIVARTGQCPPVTADESRESGWGTALLEVLGGAILPLLLGGALAGLMALIFAKRSAPNVVPASRGLVSADFLLLGSGAILLLGLVFLTLSKRREHQRLAAVLSEPNTPAGPTASSPLPHSTAVPGGPRPTADPGPREHSPPSTGRSSPGL